MSEQSAPKSRRERAQTLFVHATNGRTYAPSTGREDPALPRFVGYALHKDELQYLDITDLFGWIINGQLGFGADGLVYIGITFFPSDHTEGRVRFSGYEIKSEGELGLPPFAFHRLGMDAMHVLKQFAESGQRSKTRRRR